MDAVRKTGEARDNQTINDIAYSMSREILEDFFGKEGEGWHTQPLKDGRQLVVLHPEARKRFLNARDGG
jgi:hypothetical protein